MCCYHKSFGRCLFHFLKGVQYMFVPLRVPSISDRIDFLKYDKENCIMKKYECVACGYIYDPEVGDPDSGIAPGTAFENIPDDWECPVCGVGKDEFEPVD